MRGGAREPRARVLVGVVGDERRDRLRVVDDEDAESLAVAGVRAAPRGAGDPLEHLARHALARVAADGAPLFQQLVEGSCSGALWPIRSGCFGYSGYREVTADVELVFSDRLGRRFGSTGSSRPARGHGGALPGAGRFESASLVIAVAFVAARFGAFHGHLSHTEPARCGRRSGWRCSRRVSAVRRRGRADPHRSQLGHPDDPEAGTGARHERPVPPRPPSDATRGILPRQASAHPSRWAGGSS